jgi:hypothetical protein
MPKCAPGCSERQGVLSASLPLLRKCQAAVWRLDRPSISLGAMSPSPNFTLLDVSRPETAILLAAMLHAREAVDRRSWSHPQEPAGEEWWADVLADPRARLRSRPGGHDLRTKPVFYRLRDEPCTTLLVACSKCDWKAAFDRDELIATHGSNIGMVELLRMLTAPGCSKVERHWDRCGAYYINPIDAHKES